MKIIFMGTPEFSVPSLLAIKNDGHDISLVISQPNKPSGRGLSVSTTPVKKTCIEHDLKCIQPDSIRTTEFEDIIRDENPDVIITCAYGKIFPESIIKIPRHGIINIHASLLPELRGAAPIQWALINGMKKTGVTTMRTSIGVDTGNMLLKRSLEILDSYSYDDIYHKLSKIGADLIVETLRKLNNVELYDEPQNNDFATYAPLIKKSMGKIDWKKFGIDINNLIRGISKNPGVFSYINENRIKINKSSYSKNDAAHPPGTIVHVEKNFISVATGSGCVNIYEAVTSSGKKIIRWDNLYINGKIISVGSCFLTDI